MDLMIRTVEAYLAQERRWPAVVAALREILLGCGLDETVKWAKPCFGAAGRNVVLIQSFRDECRLMFFKGALLEDPDNMLETQGENSRAVRVMRFRSVEDVAAASVAIRGFVTAAVALEKAGAKVDFAEAREVEWPEELIAACEADEALGAAFRGLTPGRQRGYLLHFGGAKQAATRAARIEKHASRILAGKGMHDR